MINSALKVLGRLSECEHFELLYSLCRHASSYVVGGAIRDALIGLPVTDIDLITPKDPTRLAKEFARLAGGSWFWLDKSRLQSRVVFNKSNNSINYDFAPFRAPDLGEDLRDRDYTINAIALNLANKTLIDPCCGLDDLKSSILRVVTTESLANDPLRIMKGVRHAACLDMEIEPSSLQLMQNGVTELDQVAVERIRQEFFKTLAAENAGKGLWLLNESGVGNHQFGEGFERSLRTLIASIPHYQDRWNSLVNMHPYAEQWLEEEVEQGLNKRVLLLFVLLLQQVDQSLPKVIAGRWLLSRKAKTCIAALTSLDKSIMSELVSVARSPRSLYWWAHKKGVEIKLLLLFLACYDLTDDSAIEDVGSWLPIVTQIADERQPELVYGRWLSDHLGLDEGPEMSRALELLRNAEISGEVANEEEARRFLSSVYLDSD